MSSRYHVPISVALSLCLLLLSARSGMAQNDSRTMGDYRISSHNFTPTPSTPPLSADYHPFNGYPLSHYYLSPRMGMPSYMTSINYPWIYGSFDYPRAPGIYQPGIQRDQFTTSPTVYSVQVIGASAYGPEENILNTAMTPIQTTAYVNVWVPPDAELRFEGIRTDLRGTYRHFTTPPLVPGRDYTYDISATWVQNGQSVTKTRHIPIRAGQQVSVDFRTPEGAEPGTSTLRTRPLP